MRLIDADELRKVIDTSLTQYLSRLVDQDDVLEAIDNTSTVDAEPVRHGHWIEVSTTKRYRIFKCSVCRNILDFDGVNAGRGDANYCPNCGAKMDEEEIEDE